MKKLSEYQKNGLHDLINHKHFALLWSMRLRKTVVCIRYIKIMNLYPVLIVVPFSAIYEWRIQLVDDHFSINDINNISEKSDKKSRQKSLKKQSKIYLMNHDAYRSVPEIGEMHFKCMIFDEIHLLKNPKSRISNFYVKNFRNVEHRIGLTGTWLSKDELDLFQIYKFLDHSFTYPYKSYWQCCFSLFTENKFQWILKPQGKKYFNDLLQKHSNVLDYAEAGIKDRLTEIYRFVDLKKNERKIYNDMINSFILEDNFVQKSTIYSIVNYTWLRQFLSGFVEDRLLNKSKIKELEYLLDTELRNKKVVIWTFYDEETYYLARYLKCDYVNGKVKKRDCEYLIKRFQVFEQIKRIVINCRKTEGMKLSSADAEIYMNIPESRVILNQSKRRIFDIDQKEIKSCIYLLINNSIDDVIIRSHNYNVSCQKEIIKYLKGFKNAATSNKKHM